MSVRKLFSAVADLAQRASARTPIEDGQRITAFDGLSIMPGSESQLRKAGDLLLQVLPDKMLTEGRQGGKVGVEKGFVDDVYEALPALAAGVLHIGAAAIKGFITLQTLDLALERVSEAEEAARRRRDKDLSEL